MSDYEAIEALRRRLDELVVQRQRLRGERAAAEELERNRRELVAAQRRLTRALGAVHAPQAA